jgi:hypothetical protein
MPTASGVDVLVAKARSRAAIISSPLGPLPPHQDRLTVRSLLRIGCTPAFRLQRSHVLFESQHRCAGDVRVGGWMLHVEWGLRANW